MSSGSRPKSTTSARRREVRRHIREVDRRKGWWPRLWRSNLGWAIVYGLLLMTFAGVVMFTGGQPVRLQEAQVVDEPVVSRVEFTATDEQKTVQRVADARERQPSIYRANTDYLRQLREKLDDLGRLGADESIQSLDQIPEETRQAYRLTESVFAELKRYVNDAEAPGWSSLVDSFMAQFAGIPLLSSERAAIERDPDLTRSYTIRLEHPTEGRIDRFVKIVISVPEDMDALEARILPLLEKFPRALRSSVFAAVMQDPQPIYLYDEQATEAQREAAAERVKPVQMTYRPDDVLVPAGKKLSELDVELIRSEQGAYLASLGPWGRTLRLLGRVAVLGLLATGLWLYILTYKPRIAQNAMRGLALTALFMASLALAVYLTAAEPLITYFSALIPTIVTAFVLAIAYDQRFALAAGAMHALFVAVCLELGLPFLLVLVAGVAVGVWQLHEIRNRSKLVWTGLWTGLAMGAAALAVGVATRRLDLPQTTDRLLHDAMWALLAGLLGGGVVQIVLPAIEQVFKVTTAMTLLELNVASHPLLQKLAQLAPGTYQHSLRLADMSESAAEAIGANALLCRVGAMFHDIGKMNKPLYFVENQGGGPNRHDKLSPAMSVLIIVGHVKDGIEMAREYGLPAPIRHFIESHHGTTLVEYFFHAAKQRSEEANEAAPNEFEFRYPGPKPQTKEAAIMMLGDGIEGAARVLPDPNPARIEQLVRRMARKRLMDGQLDESNLTLQELYRIEQAITKTLCAIYHGRITYPKSATEERDRAAENASRPAAQAAS